MENPDLPRIGLDPDPGSLGPEELTVYGSVLAGYLIGGSLTAKAVTRAQDYLGGDFEESRPLNPPIEKVSEYLSDDDDLEEALEYFFKD